MAFDKKKFSLLLAKAKGDRSINGYGNMAKVDPGYISRLLREKVETPPSPGVIRKLAEHALPGVNYEELMTAAGHLQEPVGAEGIYNMKKALEQKVAEALQKPLAEFLPVKNIPLINAHASDHADVIEYINVPRELEADFALAVKDDAMVDVGIYPGDVAVCRKAAQARPGEMIVVRLKEGNPGIRYLLGKAGDFTLIAANSLISDQKASQPDILGVVLMIQKKALRYEQYVALREKDSRDEVITEDFLMEKLAESSGLSLAKLKKAVGSLKKK
jgi:SOS-response transcriptional repressor LexA